MRDTRNRRTFHQERKRERDHKISKGAKILNVFASYDPITFQHFNRDNL